MANNVFQVKRTNVTGRTPNTTGSYGTNSQYIAAGEFALNMADGILYSSNGSAVITVGSNLVNQNITGNLTVKAIIANGSIGSSGQTLTSNGSAVYWATGAGSGTVTQVNTGNGMTGGPITTTGTVSILANTGVVANSTGLFVNSAYIGTLTANNTSFVGSVSAANVVSNAQLSGNLANYQTTAGLASNVATLTANNSTFSYGKTEGALNVNSALTANNSTNLGGVAASGYQTTAGLSANVATLTANNANFVKANNGITSNSSGVFVTQGTGTVVNATGVHVNATYIGTLTANNTSFVGTVSAANVVSNAQLSGNLANYQTTAGLSANVATLTSNNSTFSYGKTEGALNVNSALTANNSTNLGGVAASGYQTTSGLASNVATLTSNNSTFSYGKTEGALNVNSALTANNSTNLGGQPASFYTNATNITTGTLPDARLSSAVVNTSGAFTRTGITTFSANVILGSSGLSANGGFGTAGQVLTTNGTATYWAAAAGGGYYKGGSAAVGTLAVGGQNIFRVNANTLNNNTTIAAGENAQATGPIAVASGITLTVATGARVAIV